MLFWSSFGSRQRGRLIRRCFYLRLHPGLQRRREAFLGGRTVVWALSVAGSAAAARVRMRSVLPYPARVP